MGSSASKRGLRGLLLLLVLLPLLSAPARAAEHSTWLLVEMRQPLAPDGGWLPSLYRIQGQVRFHLFEGAPNLETVRIRTGPSWDWGLLLLGANVFIAADRGLEGNFREELRGELEPTLQLDLGRLNVSDRNRFEYRWFLQETRWRYRNRLRLQLSPQDWWARPFASEEAFVDLSGQGFNENRAQLGLSFKLSDSAQLEAAYMLLTQERQARWLFTHTLVLYYQFEPPRPGG